MNITPTRTASMCRVGGNSTQHTPSPSQTEMETTTVYRGYVGIMEKKMDIIRGYIGLLDKGAASLKL